MTRYIVVERYAVVWLGAGPEESRLSVKGVGASGLASPMEEVATFT